MGAAACVYITPIYSVAYLACGQAPVPTPSEWSENILWRDTLLSRDTQCPQIAGNAVSEIQISKPFRGECPRSPRPYAPPVTKILATPLKYFTDLLCIRNTSIEKAWNLLFREAITNISLLWTIYRYLIENYTLN